MKRKIIKQFGPSELFFRLVFLPAVGIAVFYVLLGIVYFNRVLPNTYLGNLDLGGKSEQEAIVLIAERIDEFERKSTVFEVTGQRVEIANKELGIAYNKEETINQIIGTNDVLEFLTKPGDVVTSFFKKNSIRPKYNLDFNKLDSLRGLFSTFEQKPVNANFVTRSGKLEIEAEREGSLVDYSLIYDKLGTNIENFEESPVTVNLIQVTPKINAEKLENVRGKYEKLSTQKVVLKYGQEEWPISPKELLELIYIDLLHVKDGEATRIAFVPEISFSSLEVGTGISDQPEIFIRKDAFSQYLLKIGKSINRPTVDASLRFENGKVLEFSPAIDGQELNMEAATSALERNVSVQTINNDSTITINLPVKVNTAKVANEEVNRLGIKELIGKGVSYFAGSIANRAYNVGLGASRINGAVVAPGELFSFNRSVGEISGATGYRQAYVISAGRTVLDDGGGICQVSTTVFRAALNAGLPIINRTGHAYRVSYYEQRGFKPGLDATVWSPSVDLVFRNDTSHHILVQTIYDAVNSRLEVDLYGTKDNRKVEMTDPVITSQSPAPPPKYEDDPTLPKGTTKQVDFAAAGANVYFTRKVYKGDELFIDEVFKTNYRPWQAVYLVGTKEN